MKNYFVRLFLCVFLFLSYSCNKHERYAEVQIFGHGGMGMDITYSIYHDNSEEAIDLALALPTINGVEVDVRMSKDGTLWLFHESLLEITTNGSGCISELRDHEIEQLRYKGIHQEKLIKLSTMLNKLKEGQSVILDIKHWNECTQSYFDPQSVKNALFALPDDIKDQIIIDSSYPHWLADLSEEFRVIFSAVTYEDGILQLQKVPSLYGILLRNKDMNATQIAAVKAIGKTVFLTEMRSSKMQRVAMKKAPTAILSDDPRGALVIRD